MYRTLNLLLRTVNSIRFYYWGRYHQERSSQLITLKNQILLVKNLNLQSSSLVGWVAKFSVVKTRQFWNLLSSHLRFWVSFNLLSSQRLIFRLPKNPVPPEVHFHNNGFWSHDEVTFYNREYHYCCTPLDHFNKLIPLIVTICQDPCFFHFVPLRKLGAYYLRWAVHGGTTVICISSAMVLIGNGMWMERNTKLSEMLVNS